MQTTLTLSSVQTLHKLKIYVHSCDTDASFSLFTYVLQKLFLTNQIIVRRSDIILYLTIAMQAFNSCCIIHSRTLREFTKTDVSLDTA